MLFRLIILMVVFSMFDFAFANSSFSDVSNKISDVVKKVGSIFNRISRSTNDVIDDINSSSDAISRTTGSLVNSVQNDFSSLSDNVVNSKNQQTDMFDGLKQQVNRAKENISEKSTTMVQSFKKDNSLPDHLQQSQSKIKMTGRGTIKRTGTIGTINLPPRKNTIYSTTDAGLGQGRIDMRNIPQKPNFNYANRR